MYLEGKSEVIPVHVMTAYGGVDVKLHAFLTSSLEGQAVNRQLPTPTVMDNRKIHFPCRKLNFHYTDYAMPAHNVFQYTVKSQYQWAKRKHFLCKNLIITTPTPSKSMQRCTKIIICTQGKNMKRKYLTNFMMFTDLLIHPTQLFYFFYRQTLHSSFML
jgi:hypothetical protein